MCNSPPHQKPPTAGAGSSIHAGSPSIDAARSEAFAQKVLEALNGGALVLMLSLGHRTGLFDAMSGAGRLTIPQIAAKAGLNERYVREWLGAMVTGGVVEHDPGAQTFHLPPEHSAWLTRAAVPNNLAQTAQWLAVRRDRPAWMIMWGWGAMNPTAAENSAPIRNATPRPTAMILSSSGV